MTAFGVGFLGAVIAVALNVPLGLLLGPLIACLVAGISRIPVDVPQRVRKPILIILGAFLASKFTPDVANHMLGWPMSIMLLPLYIAITTGLIAWFLKRTTDMDHVTALCSAVPGGLIAMVIIGTATGGNEQRIAMAHVLRIVIAVFLVAYGLWGVFDVQTNQLALLLHMPSTDWPQLILVITLAALGGLTTGRLGLPAPHFFGPMATLAPLYMTGLVTVEIPGPLMAVALWIMGCSVGSRFYGLEVKTLIKLSGPISVSVILMLSIACLFAFIVWATLDIPFIAGLLAFAPGGVAEMSIIALAMDVDPAYVAVHHLLRIVICIIAAPLALKLVGGRRD